MAMKPRGILALVALVAVVVAATAGTLLAADPPAQATTPKAVLKIVAVTANATDPNVLKATLGDGKTEVRMGTTGLNNVSVGVPVALKGSETNVKKYAWTLTTPSASKSKLSANNEPLVKFTPDVSGIYKVDLVVSNDAGSSPMTSVQIRAGEYIGTGLGDCFRCHPATTQEWSETGHAEILTGEINGGADAANSHYGERCIGCHTTGYNPGVENGGFGSMQAATGWKFPELAEIQKGTDNWGAMPVLLQNMANIQCEVCHGPAKDHVQNGAKMAASLDDGVCNVCHAGGGHHVKGIQIQNAKHADEESRSWSYPTGPSRQACVRCHSGAGYISFIENPTEPATWDNSAHTVGCSTCHDPHAHGNKFQLRITGAPVEVAGVTKDFGLSATCAECHWGRTTAADAQKASFPHYSPAAEMLADTGGVTYGQNVPNSAHGMIVGTFPVKVDDTELFGGVNPGPCVVCHMWPAPADTKDPNHYTVGEHSFNVASPDGTFQYTASCQACHQGVQNFADFKAKADYDGNGQTETVQAEVAGMLKVLQKAINDSGVKATDGHPYFDRTDVANSNASQKNAIYNYLFVRGLSGSDGKANAMHNFKRSIGLLQLSYKDLTGNDVPNATAIK